MSDDLTTHEFSSSLDECLVCQAATPPETIAGESEQSKTIVNPTDSSVPWPGSDFIIRSVSCGRVVTLLDGRVVLSRPGGRGSIHWSCVETSGWLGFRNTVSGHFLGHDWDGNLRCTARDHNWWEWFTVRPRPEGGFVLFLTHKTALWHVGTKLDNGEERLAKLDHGGSGGLTWEFIKVNQVN